MKKLLLATVLALGVADATYASQYVSPWYEGQYFCNVEGSNDRFGIRFTIESVPNTKCQGDRCSISGYKLIRHASIRMTGWDRPYSGDFVVDHGDYITFYFIDNKHFVKLNKPTRFGSHRFPARGIYQNGDKTWNISCRKA